MPTQQERPELALEVAGGVRVGAGAELQRQELVLHAEGERVDDEVEPVRVADHRGRLEQAALRVTWDQPVLAGSDAVGVPADAAQPLAGDQVGVGAVVAGHHEVVRRSAAAGELHQGQVGHGVELAQVGGLEALEEDPVARAAQAVGAERGQHRLLEGEAGPVEYVGCLVSG